MFPSTSRTCTLYKCTVRVCEHVHCPSAIVHCAGVFSKHIVHVHFYVNVRVHVLVHSRLFNHIFYMKTCIWPAANPILIQNFHILMLLINL